jgi:hypothetical protein
LPIVRREFLPLTDSSVLTCFPAHLKAAKYRAPKNVTFAPNVTPATFEKTRPIDVKTEEGVQAEEVKPMLFPPCASPRGPPKKKQPKDRRRSQGYIPRPPNAFMLFRADFVKQKHVPGTIEPDHTNLSKIIGELPVPLTTVIATMCAHTSECTRDFMHSEAAGVLRRSAVEDALERQ